MSVGCLLPPSTPFLPPGPSALSSPFSPPPSAPRVSLSLESGAVNMHEGGGEAKGEEMG